MKLVDLIKLRDRAIKNKIVTSLPIEYREQFYSQIDHLFKEASDDWINEQLPLLRDEKWAKELAK